MKITIQGPDYRALYACAADPLEVRYYLRGFCIEQDGESYTATSTDGHGLVSVPVDVEGAPDKLPPLIVPCGKKPPRKLDAAVLEVEGNPRLRTIDTRLYKSSGRLLRDERSTEIDARYPTWRTLISDTLTDKMPADWAINPQLLARVSSCYENDKAHAGVRLRWNSKAQATSACIAEVYEHPDVVLLAMPLRW